MATGTSVFGIGTFDNFEVVAAREIGVSSGTR